MMAKYPEFSEISMDLREVPHPRFKSLAEGISEFTFANIYLFREAHRYKISQLNGELFVITGEDMSESFFMLPFGLPDENVLRELFAEYHNMKTVPEPQAKLLAQSGYQVWEDRDNFDYLYSREDLVNLTGRKFHKKKNLLNMFIRNNECQAKPLLEENRDDALQVLEAWNERHGGGGDYAAA